MIEPYVTGSEGVPQVKQNRHIAMNRMALDLSSPHGWMLATFLSSIAEFERDLISERMKSGPPRRHTARNSAARPEGTQSRTD